MVLAAVTVTAPVPVDFSVTVCVVAALTFSVPKEMLAALKPSVGTAAPRLMPNVSFTLPALAVTVSDCPVLTAATVAENVAVADPAATVTEEGTVTAELLLASFTANPPVAAAAFSVTVQESVPDPEKAELVHVSPLSTGMPVPLRLTAVEFPVDESEASVSWPAAAPAAEGSNFTFSVADWPGLNSSGKLAPETEKPDPLMVAELMVSVAAPVELTAIDCTTDVPTLSLPKARLVELMLRVGEATSSSIAKLVDAEFKVAVSVTAWDLLKEVTVAEKLAVVSPAATVTEGGTETAGLLLERSTATPPLGAAELSVTVQASVPGPETLALLQLSPLTFRLETLVTPLPLSAAVAVLLEEASLTTVSSPVAAPAADGLNSTVTP